MVKEIRDWPFRPDSKAGSAADFEKEIESAGRNFDFERSAMLRSLIKNIKGDKQ